MSVEENFIPPALVAPTAGDTAEQKRFVQCCIVRDARLNARYELSFQGAKHEKVSLIAEKQAAGAGGKTLTKYYIFDVSRGGNKLPKLTKKSSNYLGKLCNDPKSRCTYSLNNAKNPKEQVGAFIYRSISLTSQLKEGQPPRKLTVALPKVDQSTGKSKSSKVTWQHKMVQCLEENGGSEDLVICTSKDPTFDGGQYRLNFGGRVTTPSVKNMQLLNDQGEIVAQFGRVGQDRFHLDYR